MKADNQILLNGITPEELVELIRIVFQDEMRKIKSEEDEKLMSPAETCKLFIPTITKATLTSWTNQGLLDQYRIGGRIFYKKSEMIEKAKTLQKYKTIYSQAA
jgi:hypothetical protein